MVKVLKISPPVRHRIEGFITFALAAFIVMTYLPSKELPTSTVMTPPVVHQAVNTALPGSTAGQFNYDIFSPVHNGALLKQRLTTRCEPELPSKDELGSLRGRKWPLWGYVSYYNIEKVIEKLLKESPKPPDVLEAGRTRFFEGFRDRINATETKYPGVDLHATPYADNSFDIVGADQVLEHVLFPYQMILELHRVLKPGGLAIVSTCASNPIHDMVVYHDLWRFQPDGLLALSLPFSKVTQCGSWGTAEVVKIRYTLGIVTPEEKSAYWQMQDRAVLENEMQHPMTTWIIMQK